MDVSDRLLVIADIGGYTRYMLATRISLAHAQLAVTALLEAVLDGADGLTLAKLEGDAAFFHAPASAVTTLPAAVGAIRTRFAATSSWSRESLKTFPKRGPLESLHLVPAEGAAVLGALNEPAAFVAWANFGNAVGTWNVADPAASWASAPGAWLVVDAELSRAEDDDWGYGGLCVIFAAWRVDEGLAVGISPSGALEASRLAAVSTIPWPETWATARVWYGER